MKRFLDRMDEAEVMMGKAGYFKSIKTADMYFAAIKKVYDEFCAQDLDADEQVRLDEIYNEAVMLGEDRKASGWYEKKYGKIE